MACVAGVSLGAVCARQASALSAVAFLGFKRPKFSPTPSSASMKRSSALLSAQFTLKCPAAETNLFAESSAAALNKRNPANLLGKKLRI